MTKRNIQKNRNWKLSWSHFREGSLIYKNCGHSIIIIIFDLKRTCNMIKITRTDSTHQDFNTLVKHLDAELAERDGKDHPFYAQYNKIDNIKYVLIAYEDDKPVSCGALKEYGPTVMEIKRMYTLPEFRGRGTATKILIELETWAGELSYRKCILETGKKQPEAIALYKKNGYKIIPNYGQYAGIENSVCFEKVLT
jgi:GNAT superfamily N-acetyltransferase